MVYFSPGLFVVIIIRWQIYSEGDRWMKVFAVRFRSYFAFNIGYMATIFIMRNYYYYLTIITIIETRYSKRCY